MIKFDFKSVLQTILLFVVGVILCAIFIKISLFFNVDATIEYARQIMMFVNIVLIIISYKYWKIKFLGKLGNVTLKKIIITLISTLLFFIILYILLNWKYFSWDNFIGINNLGQLPNSHFLLYLVSVFVMGPILEEVLWRGITQEYLCRKNSLIVSILISSLLFSLFHLSLRQIPSTFLGGVYLGVLYYKTQSLTCAITAHSFYNLLSIFVKIGWSLLYFIRKYYV